jgi:hypothetical protein
MGGRDRRSAVCCWCGNRRWLKRELFFPRLIARLSSVRTSGSGFKLAAEGFSSVTLLERVLAMAVPC